MLEKDIVLNTLNIHDLCNYSSESYSDLQGWNSDSQVLLNCVNQIEHPLVVEVGVWKGRSVISILREFQVNKRECLIIAVDTFLGSSEHYLRGPYVEDVGVDSNFRIKLLDQFISNVVSNGFQDSVIPLPLDSQSACELLGRRGLSPDVIHLDAGHHYFSILLDLHSWWGLLKPGGYMVCDDYSEHEWPSVVNAVNDFLTKINYEEFQTDGVKCSFRKPINSGIIPSLDINVISNSNIQSENSLLKAEVAAIDFRLQQLQSSLSWKLTKPLRSIRTVLSKK